MDYGSNPLGDGKHKMVPSGDIVDRAERDRRLAAWKDAKGKQETKNDCLGLSWDEIERRQGGKLNRD